MVYFAAFIPGMQELAETVIRERLSDAVIKKLADGAVIFETAVTYDRLNFFCFNNIFLVIDVLEKKEGKQKTGKDLLEFHMEKILSGRKCSLDAISGNTRQTKTFRLVCSSENTLVPVNENAKRGMEKFISDVSQLKSNRSGPDTEFWFLYRSEGFSCFMKRLTNNRATEKTLHPGELSPQLAWMLCKTAGLKHGETAADPFCGYGSIPFAACRYFPISKFYASDADPKCVKITASKNITGNNDSGRLILFKNDINSVSGKIKEKADAVITDPPWGLYREGENPAELYDQMIAVFASILKDNGRAVILTAAVKELESSAGKSGIFIIQKKIPILVSGKKAVVFMLTKTGTAAS